MPALLTLDSLALTTPDGRELFSGLTLTIENDRVGLVGRNGSGKSTLLQSIIAQRAPQSGSITCTASIGHIQQVPIREGRDVANGLGICEQLSTLARALKGDLQPDADIDWDLETKAEKALARSGLSGVSLTRPLSTLSGGELTRLATARLWLERPQLLLLDEPTNNLDMDGRAAIVDLIASWRGGVLVASHDRDLLEHMDRIVELSPTGCTIFGGGWSEFANARQAAREAARARLASAEKRLGEAQSAARSRQEKKERRDRTGKVARASGSQSKLFLDAQKERSQQTGGRDAALASRQIEEAQAEREVARQQVAILTPVAMELAPTNLPSGRTVLKVDALTYQIGERTLGPWSLDIRGPERVAISGPNGAGKTTLLKLLLGTLTPTSGTVTHVTPTLAYLDQHVDHLTGDGTLFEAMIAGNAALDNNAARAMLARFGFRNRMADKPVSALSGGERLRAGLACVMAADPPPDLLILDEPTNHLDIESVDILEAALNGYDGAILVVSHDQRFLDAIRIDRRFNV